MNSKLQNLIRYAIMFAVIIDDSEDVQTVAMD